MGRFSHLTVSTSAWLPWATVVFILNICFTNKIIFVELDSETILDIASFIKNGL